MAKLALATEFLDAFSRLQPRIRAKVSEQAGMFQQLKAHELNQLKGLRLKSHTNAADPRARTIRVDDNHRGIVFDAGNEYFILTMIGTHDETDRWMANNHFKVNVATGALEIIDAGSIAAEVQAIQPEPGTPPLFDHRKDKDFVQLGIDPDLVAALRAFTDEDQLQGLLKVVPPAQADALIELTTEATVERIYAEVIGRQPRTEVNPDDLAAALEVPASRSRFHLVEDQDALADILEKPLAQWRIFLHPYQRDIVERDVYNGPVRVTGGAGTGKTVVAIHRARNLADRLAPGSGEAVLFTTYTRNLAQAIEEDLELLGGQKLLQSVEVTNVDRVANAIVREAEGRLPSVANNQVTDSLWREVVQDLGIDQSAEFLSAEWEQVVLAQNLREQTEYFRANRAGRGVPLDRRARVDVWQAIREFTSRLAATGKRTYLQLADDAAEALASRVFKPYQHVVVDEAQDLHECQWRLLRALVDEGPNDLFIVGDSHQRIYDRRSSLSKVGINIIGRSKKLKINYRTTHEILAWSLALLGEENFDDLDGGTDNHDFAGYHSYRHGPAPTISGHDSQAEQLRALATKVTQWVGDGVHEEAIGVAVRGRASFDGIDEALSAAGRTVCQLKADQPTSPGIRVGTMHRMKGLEFQRVAIVDLYDRWFPAPAALSSEPTQRANDLQRELCLLYVAATRARDELWLSWHTEPTRFLGAVEEQ